MNSVRPVLEINGLSMFYENVMAISKLNLQMEESEVLAVLGSNGAGKTTLMNTISGLILDTKRKEKLKGGIAITIDGRIKFRGEDISDIDPWDRVKKGIVLSRERRPIFRESTVLENMKISAYRMRSRSEAAEDFKRIFDLFQPLAKHKKRQAGFLSGGEQQMLSIAISLLARPSLFLLDEPLFGLAPLIQRVVVDSIKQIRDTGVSILIAEQFAMPLFSLLDRAYVIENGMVVLSGSRQELIDNPEVESTYFGIGKFAS